MSLIGATPDAIVTMPGGKIVATIEAKCRCPFFLSGVASFDLLTETVPLHYLAGFRLQCCAAGDKWTYIPILRAMAMDNMDAAYLLQVQLQLHATGADVGYLFSWSRTDVTVHSVRYRHTLITAAAHVLKHVIKQFVNPATVPSFPSDASQFQSNCALLGLIFTTRWEH